MHGPSSSQPVSLLELNELNKAQGMSSLLNAKVIHKRLEAFFEKGHAKVRVRRPDPDEDQNRLSSRPNRFDNLRGPQDQISFAYFFLVSLFPPGTFKGHFG